MANTLLNFSLLCIISIFISSGLYQVIAESSDDSLADLPAKHNPNLMEPKLTKFDVYWHDIVSGSHPTAVTIIKPPTANVNGFGMVNMIDNALTLGPNLTSKVVGRSQGFYASAAQGEISALMVMNFVFTDGEFNGSAISIFGRNPGLSPVRELSVIGGTGLFRLARGYVELRTQMFNKQTGDATVKYSVNVMHY